MVNSPDLESKDFLIIIPTYNEMGNIEKLLKQITTNEKFATSNIRIVIVDDNSPDLTGRHVDELHLDKVSVLQRSEKRGLGEAYKAGFEYAVLENFKFVIEMDADLSHRVEDLWKLIDAERSYDLVIGSRWIDGGKIVNWPRHRELISRLGNFYSRKILKSKLKDLTSGFRRISVPTLININWGSLESSGYAFQIEVAHRIEDMGRDILEIPITFIERESGSSKMNFGIAKEAILNVTIWSFRKQKLICSKK